MRLAILDGDGVLHFKLLCKVVLDHFMQSLVRTRRFVMHDIVVVNGPCLMKLMTLLNLLAIKHLKLRV